MINFIQTKKGRVLVSSTGVLSQGHTRGRSWRWQRLLARRLLGKSYEELTIAPNCRLFSMGCLHEGVNISLGPHRPLGQTKWTLRQQYHGVA